jgi:hypothetical protein
MIRNYFVTAMRNIARHKVFSLFNIAGLAVPSDWLFSSWPPAGQGDRHT